MRAGPPRALRRAGRPGLAVPPIRGGLAREAPVGDPRPPGTRRGGEERLRGQAADPRKNNRGFRRRPGRDSFPGPQSGRRGAGRGRSEGVLTIFRGQSTPGPVVRVGGVSRLAAQCVLVRALGPAAGRCCGLLHACARRKAFAPSASIPAEFMGCFSGEALGTHGALLEEAPGRGPGGPPQTGRRSAYCCVHPPPVGQEPTPGTSPL